MAGRIQLTTRGVQDVYFTENPDYSYFVQLFRKHTNYTSQFVKLDLDNDTEFGKTVRITIPKDQGDLIKTISLEVELDKIEGADITRYGYVESIGHAMIEYIDMYIGDEKIQHIPSDYLQIYSEQNYTQTKQKALEKLVGKYPDRTSDVPVSSGVILGHLGPATKTVPLYIDIPFYFYRKPELAIHLCAMCFQEVTLEIKFRELKHCLVKTDPPLDTTLQTTTLDYEVSGSTVLTSDVISVSYDGTTVASRGTGNTIEIPGKTTFNGTGVVSPAMNVIVTSGFINRYENGQWEAYADNTINGSNDLRFSDDGSVILEVGTGIWKWDGSDYVHTSISGVVGLSRDGNFYINEPSQTGPNIEIRNVSTNARLGGVIVKPSNTAVSEAHLSQDGSKLLFVINDVLYVYQHTSDWLRYGQDVGLYETGKITFTKNGNSFFIYNVNERYDISVTPVKQGVGYLYVYDTTTTQWVKVFRYTGAGGTFSFVNDTNLKIFVKRSNSITDAITLKELTRSVEGYDEVVVKSIENIVDSGSNVFGGGYQSLVSQTVDAVLFNENTTYATNNTDFLQVGPADELEISNNGIVTCVLFNVLGQLRVYKRLTDTSSFDRMNFEGTAGLTVGSITFSKSTLSPTGRYLAVEDRVAGKVYIYEIFTNDFRNIQYVEGTPPVPNTMAFVSLTSLEGIKFYDDESKIILFGGNEVKIFDLSSTMPLSQTITDNSTPSFNHPIVSVSKDINRFIKYDSTGNIVKIMTINENGSIVSSLPIVPLTQVIAFDLSKDGTLAAFVTSGFTYIYSYDGFGWRQKSSLFVGIQTFTKFHMSDDGNTLTYVKSETVPNLTIIELYQYINNSWSRIHQENDNSTAGTLGVGAVSFNNQYLYSLRSHPTYVRRSTRVKKINKQQTASIVVVDQDISQVYQKQIKSCKLSLEVVFLDKYERAIIKNKGKDYVISQLQHNQFLAPKSIESHKFRTSFLNPVKELYFIVKRVNNEQYLDFVSPFDYDNDKITSENKLIFYENLKSLEFKLNDTQVLDQDTGNFAFLKAIQPAIHHSKTPLIRRFYTYSFCMEPEQHFPTGQVNFSLINNQLFTFNLTDNTTSDRHVDIYALSYNILRLDKGMMRVMFNTT